MFKSLKTSNNLIVLNDGKPNASFGIHFPLKHSGTEKNNYSNQYG